MLKYNICYWNGKRNARSVRKYPQATYFKAYPLLMSYLGDRQIFKEAVSFYFPLGEHQNNKQHFQTKIFQIFLKSFRKLNYFF